MANFAQLGIQIDSKQAEDAASDLDKLTAAGARAEAATNKLSKSTTDWAAEQQKANARAREMEAQDARRAASAQKANTAIKDQQQELAKLLGAIDPAVAALGRLDEQERKLAQFRKQGAIDSETFAQYNKRLQDQRNILGGVADAQGKAGMSARAYSAAMRNVPAQITDITTSLIGGQPAYLVALQQGGQLKDMFGGIGPAARALTSSLVSMINPVTILAAVVGTLGVAWYQASNAEFEFNKALIQTGDYANLSGKSVSAMADAMGRLDGITRGGAASAIMAVASSGKIAADNFDLVSVAAAKMASSAGSSIDSTVAKFESIANEPVSALLKLNETEHFLTNAQLARVDALVKEGNETAAVSLATQIYAGHLDDVDQKIRSSMPAMVQWWRNVKDEISSAWGELAEFGGLLGDVLAKVGVSKQASSTGATFLTPIVGQLKMATGLLDILNREGAKFWGTGGASTPQVRMAGIYSPDYEQVDSKAYEAGKKAKEAADAANKAWQQTLASTDKAVAQRLALAEIETKGNAAGIAQVEIEKQKDAYIKQQAASSERSVRASASRIPQLTEEQKAAQALARSYESITSQMQRQLALSGDNSSLGRVNYEISSGNLRGLGADEQAKIRNLAITQDAVDDFAAIYGDGINKVVADTKSGTDLMTEYGIQAARNMQSSFADFLFDPFEDGLSGMAKSFAKTLQRMAAEAAAAQIFKSIGGWASGYTGAGSSWINMIGGLIAGGKAEGGYTGPGGKYEPRGIVHAGEVVWSQRDVAAVGGPRAANAMRPTAGYANGGGPGLPASRGMASSAAPQVTFNITTENGNANVTQQGAAESLGRELKNAVVPIVAEWYAKNSRPGGAVYNGRMGTA